MAKQISMVNLSEFYSSITVDSSEGGGYLYLWISMSQRGCMYKIGTGENGTIAGKVYNHAYHPDKEGEMTWVYCQGKLYARRVNEGDLGHLLVYDPSTFKLETTAKINLTVPASANQIPCDDPAQAAKHATMVNALNRYYPLLTDGNNLFAVTINVSTKRLRVKDTMRKHYQQFQEDKKKQKTELKPTSSSSA